MLPSGIRSLVPMALLAVTAPASGAPTLLQKVDVSADGEVTIRIHLSRPVPPRAGTVGRMGANPDRLFVDLPDTVLGPRARAAIPGRPPVLRVRTGQHEATARVVIDMEHATPFTVKTDSALVTVTLVSAPQAPAASASAPPAVPPPVETPPVVAPPPPRAEEPPRPTAAPAPAPETETADQPSRSLTYHNDRLSVRLTAVPLEQVMADLGQASGAAVYGTVRQSRDVSAQFDDVPLVAALHRLLADQDFVLKYGKDGCLRAIKLLSESHVPIATVATSAPTTPAPDVPAAMPGVPRDARVALAMLDGQPPVPLSGALVQVLGTEAATFRQLFDAASHNEDAIVRADAMRAFIGALDAEPEFRDVVLEQLNTLDDFTLTELLRGLAGSRAEEIAAQIAANAHVSELSSRAFGILLRLGGPRGSGNAPDARPAG